MEKVFKFFPGLKHIYSPDQGMSITAAQTKVIELTSKLADIELRLTSSKPEQVETFYVTASGVSPQIITDPTNTVDQKFIDLAVSSKEMNGLVARLSFARKVIVNATERVSSLSTLDHFKEFGLIDEIPSFKKQINNLAYEIQSCRIVLESSRLSIEDMAPFSELFSQEEFLTALDLEGQVAWLGNKLVASQNSFLRKLKSFSGTVTHKDASSGIHSQITTKPFYSKEFIDSNYDQIMVDYNDLQKQVNTYKAKFRDAVRKKMNSLQEEVNTLVAEEQAMTNELSKQCFTEKAELISLLTSFRLRV